MAKINLLSDETINQIAAGEVVENPRSVVKELVENSIDAGATAISVEIKDGGISFIRITDNGSGIERDDIRNAFLRHSTSKITDASDLFGVESLGFRGEALASIAAVAKCELITRTADSLVGVRYVIEGGKEISYEEIGVPAGTTFIIRDLFYNTPARKKFLRSASTEGANVTEAVFRLALAHPDISFHITSGNQTKLHTSGNGNKKDVIYAIYGKDTARLLLSKEAETDGMRLEGYIGKPVISRGNRSYEIFEVNGRTIRSKLLQKAVEDAYHGFVMQHKYPFAVISLTLSGEAVDVNVHPSKLEVRFRNEDEVYDFVKNAVLDTLSEKELIYTGTVDIPAEPDEEPEKTVPVLKEKEQDIIPAAPSEPEAAPAADEPSDTPESEEPAYAEPFEKLRMKETLSFETVPAREQQSMQEEDFFREILTESAKHYFKLIGTVFDTYLLVEYKDDFLIIDQHAAHEKVLYERFMRDFRNKTHTSQQLNPPIVLTLSDRELSALNSNIDSFKEIGFEIEYYGGREIAVYAVPDNLYGIAREDLLIEMLDDIADETGHGRSTLITDKIAMMSCKAAVKGANRLSAAEADALIMELLGLENPYTCPHGRPTAIKLGKYELDKKFRRIL